ncbi:hypothetical protein EMIT0215P_10507 [Pseudomonas serboccidentalis]
MLQDDVVAVELIALVERRALFNQCRYGMDWKLFSSKMTKKLSFMTVSNRAGSKYIGDRLTGQINHIKEWQICLVEKKKLLMFLGIQKTLALSLLMLTVKDF